MYIVYQNDKMAGYLYTNSTKLLYNFPNSSCNLINSIPHPTNLLVRDKLDYTQNVTVLAKLEVG